jgi:hypothetical protein
MQCHMHVLVNVCMRTSFALWVCSVRNCRMPAWVFIVWHGAWPCSSYEWQWETRSVGRVIARVHGFLSISWHFVRQVDVLQPAVSCCTHGHTRLFAPPDHATWVCSRERGSSAPACACQAPGRVCWAAQHGGGVGTHTQPPKPAPSPAHARYSRHVTQTRGHSPSQHNHSHK